MAGKEPDQLRSGVTCSANNTCNHGM
jgi:hypothetical protein